MDIVEIVGENELESHNCIEITRARQWYLGSRAVLHNNTLLNRYDNGRVIYS